MQNFGRGMWRRLNDYQTIQNMNQISIKNVQLQQYLAHQEIKKKMKRFNEINAFSQKILLEKKAELKESKIIESIGNKDNIILENNDSNNILTNNDIIDNNDILDNNDIINNNDIKDNNDIIDNNDILNNNDIKDNIDLQEKKDILTNNDVLIHNEEKVIEVNNSKTAPKKNKKY
jgi:hypothetical protein